MTEFGGRNPRNSDTAWLKALSDPVHRATFYSALSWVLCIGTLLALICNKIYGLGPQIPGVAIILPPLALVVVLQFLLIQITLKRNRPPKKRPKR
jgi:hypothetical protein